MTNELGITSFVALGDSFTEGLMDVRPDGTMRGWADRLAERLAHDAPGFTYANLAVRGRLLEQIVEDQLHLAIAAAPDLVAFSAGGNDILRVGSDPDEVAARYEQALVGLLATGARVLVFTGFDVGATPVLRLVRGKIAVYNEHLRVLAARHGADVVDLWGLTPLRDRRAFSPDRLHLSGDGHERVTRLVAQTLGLPTADPFEPWPNDAVAAATRHDDIVWAREHFLPWVSRHLRGRSSGDGLEPKRPDLAGL
ncbi:SGNH/GDSL hydrolase family protein [uncultured Jatrophihabitans sp.]|uniref:SGNH/GDSL hydrolase family protein n=1 Tax=uncultured Jatrophihabitans sp. TaxID=1610747 RepID=UPI0035CC3EB7